MTITYDKDGAYIEVVTDGVSYRRSIRLEDCVVSIPGGSNLKVDLVYVNSSNQLVLVLEDDTEISVSETVDHGALTGLSDHDHNYAEFKNQYNSARMFEVTAGVPYMPACEGMKWFNIESGEALYFDTNNEKLVIQ